MSTQKRPSIATIDSDIKARFGKTMGKFGSFFVNWIKFEDNTDKLYLAIGEKGENYLQFKLSENDVLEALVVLEVAKSYWEEKQQGKRVFTFLNHEDAEQNGIWHYLADTLRGNEGRETMKIAHTLLSLDVDFSRANKQGISPLGKILVPTPKWQSINALIQTKHLSIEHVDRAITERAKEDQIRAHFMSMIFAGDLADNRGLLSQHVLKQAVMPQATRSLRETTCRLFFDYKNVQDGSTAFLKLISITNDGMFEDLLNLLQQNVEETVTAMAAPDVVTKKAYRQVLLCRRLLRRDKAMNGVLQKALMAKKYGHLRKMISLLHHDDLHIKKSVRGELVRQDIPVDQTSPAPTNPMLSLLLQRDRENNTIFHLAMLENDLRAFGICLYGLPSNDVYAILTRVPNGYGLTLTDLLNADKVKTNMIAAIQAGLIDQAKAKDILQKASAIDKEMQEAISTKLQEISELAETSRHGKPPEPNFDFRKLAETATPMKRAAAAS
ncbi:MAG: hypothetical protein ABWY00_15030 [Dongiaceae bacterium]